MKNKEKIIIEIKNNSENNGPIKSNNGKKTRPYPKKKVENLFLNSLIM